MANRESSKENLEYPEPAKIPGKHRFMAGSCVDCGKPLAPTCVSFASKLPAPIEDAPTDLVCEDCGGSMRRGYCPCEPSAAPESAEPRIPRLEVEVEILAEAVVSIAVACGITDGSMPMTGPEVMQMFRDSVDCIHRLKAEVERLSPKASEWIAVDQDVCGYCGEGGTDHKHADGTRCCGDCCATHGGLAHTDRPAYDLMRKMHHRIRCLSCKPSDFLTELDRRVAAIHRRGGDIKDTAVRQLKEER